MDCDPKKYSFLTVYKKDYVEKPIKLVSLVGRKQEFADPISEGFRHYLVLDEHNVASPNEDAEQYLEKFKEEFKDAGKIYFSTPLNKEVIFRNQITKDCISEYQLKYCDVEKDIQYYLEKRKRKQSLPYDIKIPLTTYTTDFRDPSLCFGGKIPKPLIVIAPDNLETSGKLEITNPVSDYMDKISRLGGTIIETQFKNYKQRKNPQNKNL